MRCITGFALKSGNSEGFVAFAYFISNKLADRRMNMINKTKKSDFLKRLTVLAMVFGVLLSLLSSVPFKKLNAQTENVLWIGPDANYAWFGQQVALEAGKRDRNFCGAEYCRNDTYFKRGHIH